VARAAEAELAHGSVVGFAIGTEPDLYDAPWWSSIYSPLRQVLGVSLGRVLGSFLPRDFAPRDYVDVFYSYARALETFAPRVPLVGPAVANPARDIDWIASLLRSPPGLGIVSGHRYAYSACVHDPLAPTYPTVARLLSERATAGMARALEPAVELAHDASLPFRLTELNSVTCGGLPGVSDTFATALWARTRFSTCCEQAPTASTSTFDTPSTRRSPWPRSSPTAVRPRPVHAPRHRSVG
jgi:hypothetical protein